MATSVRRCLAVAIVLALAGALVPGCRKSAAPPPQPVAPPKPQAAPRAQQPERKVRVVYLPRFGGETTRFRAKALTALGPGAGPRDVLQEAVRLLDLPKGLKVLSWKVDENGVAQVSLSKEIDSFASGTSGEAAAVNSLVLTAGQFPGVKKVVFLREGKPMETFGGSGHLDLTEPVAPNWSLVDHPRDRT